MIVIGITGTLGAGKSTIVEHLKKKSFKHFSARAYIEEEIVRRGVPVNRDSMTIVANELRAKHGSDFIVRELYKKAEASKHNAVIESIRTAGEARYLKGRGKFVFFAVDADIRQRYQRVSARKSVADGITYEKFVADEEREMRSDDPTKQNIAACIRLADYTFINNTTKEDLWREVDAALVKCVP
jgi:dephospho-CoA kinase